MTHQEKAILEMYPTAEEIEQDSYHVDNAYSTQDLINRIQHGALYASSN